MIFVIVVGILLVILLLASRSPSKKLYSGISQDLYDFLEAADNAYIQMYQSKSIKTFTPYASRELLYNLADMLPEADLRLFGSDKYRRREWLLVDNSSVFFRVKKQVTYKNIELRSGIKVALGDDMEEVWTVTRVNNKYCVMNIEDGK